jgi:hypothetical protein
VVTFGGEEGVATTSYLSLELLGPTPGYTGQTVGTGSADTKQHPPTDTMNRVTGEKAASSQDAQKQMQGQPTAAQEAMGAIGLRRKQRTRLLSRHNESVITTPLGALPGRQ